MRDGRAMQNVDCGRRNERQMWWKISTFLDIGSNFVGISREKMWLVQRWKVLEIARERPNFLNIALKRHGLGVG
jgi:hypothetical protein